LVHFDIVKSIELPDSGRCIYLMTARRRPGG
jgi:hypothetical protein